jgi:hypothetical protein
VDEHKDDNEFHREPDERQRQEATDGKGLNMDVSVSRKSAPMSEGYRQDRQKSDPRRNLLKATTPNTCCLRSSPSRIDETNSHAVSQRVGKKRRPHRA